jgi:hypothetical protein
MKKTVAPRFGGQQVGGLVQFAPAARVECVPDAVAKIFVHRFPLDRSLDRIDLKTLGKTHYQNSLSDGESIAHQLDSTRSRRAAGHVTAG